MRSPHRIQLVIALVFVQYATVGESHKVKASILQDRTSYFNLQAKSSDHPLLFFDRRDVDVMISQSSSTHKHLTEKISQLASQVKITLDFLLPTDERLFRQNSSESSVNYLPVAVFYSLLNPTDNEMKATVVKMIDRLTSYSSWYLEAKPEDDSNMSVVLIAYATVVDMFYLQLSERQQKLCIDKISAMTGRLYKLSEYKWWSSAYLTTQFFTNTAALLIGSNV